MKNIIEVKFSIIDRGTRHPLKTMEVTVSEGNPVFDQLKKQVNADRHAMDLSPKFLLDIIEERHIGWA